MGADSLSKKISIWRGVPGETFNSPVTSLPACLTPTPRTGSGARSVRFLVISNSLEINCFQHLKIFLKCVLDKHQVCGQLYLKTTYSCSWNPAGSTSRRVIVWFLKDNMEHLTCKVSLVSLGVENPSTVSSFSITKVW